MLLRGLSSRPELNGTWAEVLPPADPAEAARLDGAARVKVTAYPKPLALKRGNVRLVTDQGARAADWTIAGQHGAAKAATLRDTVVKTELGDASDGEALLRGVWATLTGGAAVPPRRFLAPDELGDGVRERILNHTRDHCVYFLALEQIAAHLVLETNCASGRVYASTPGAAGAGEAAAGYTAREWLTGMDDAVFVEYWANLAVAEQVASEAGPDTPPSRPDPPALALRAGLRRPRQAWGGLEPVRRAKLAELLDLVFELQRLAGPVADAMAAGTPEEIRAADAAPPPNVLEDGPQPAGGMLEWAAALADGADAGLEVVDPGAAGEPTVVRTLPGGFGHPATFTVPAAVADPFAAAYERLVGGRPRPRAYAAALEFRSWRTVMAWHEEAGAADATGWAWWAASVPH